MSPDFSYKSISCGSFFTVVTTSWGLYIIGLLPEPIINHNVCDRSIEYAAAGGKHIAYLVTIPILHSLEIRNYLINIYNFYFIIFISFQAKRRWVVDEEVLSCPSCNLQFNSMRRRHHCRNCGKIFCNDCSKKRAMILKLGYDREVRVCNSCYEAIKNVTYI